MEDPQSSVSMWVCLMLSVGLIAVRLCLRRVRHQRFAVGDYWCLAAAVFIIGRLIANHFLLLYGSTRTLTSDRRVELMSPAFEAERIKVITGSKLVLATRSQLICILWCLKMAVLDLLARLIIKMPYERKALYMLWTILFATFVASFTTVFAECHSFSKHWQILPNPGDCVIGNMWLITYGSSNIITDIILMAVPFSLILSVKIPIWQRLRILFLFGIGTFLIIISIMRIIQGKGSRVQRAHTLWASLEVLFASVVAVTPTIYALAWNYSEDTTAYSRSHISMNLASKTHPGSVVDRDGYAARVWTELNDEGSRTDNTSVEGILVETSHKTSHARV